MTYIKNLTQTQQAFLLSLYIGFILNIGIFIQRYNSNELIMFVPQSIIIGIEIISSIGCCFLLLRFFSIFGRFFYRILATLVSLISVCASYYMSMFHITIGYGVIASVMTTQDMDLFSEVLGWQTVMWFVVVSIIPLILIWVPNLKETLIKQLCHWRTAVKALTIIVITSAIVWVPLKYLDKVHKDNQKKYNFDSPSYSGTLAYSYLPINWLDALTLYIYTNVGNPQDYSSLPNPAEKFSYSPMNSLDNTYVIFIIGETTRGDHMSLLGYDRETTPLLAKEPNLIALQGRSCDTATKLSLRCMFVREGDAVDDGPRTLKAQNIFSVLSKLGFTSELFAMQGEVWFYGMLGLNNYEFRETISAEKENIGKKLDDMTLINKIDQSLNRYPRGKHLIILHTKGSHYLYSARYPREFARYQPECFGIDDTCSKAQYINSFDNSVLYTDYFIKNVIDQVRDKKAIIFYASDHGESIEDGQHFHGTPRSIAPAEQFNVPLLIWMSDSLLSSTEQKKLWKNLKQNSLLKKIHRHEEIYDSILGCLGYQSTNGGINQHNNWCVSPD